VRKSPGVNGFKKYADALELLNKISEVGPFVSSEYFARALRGKGAALTEMGRVAEAEDAFTASLKIEPNNEIAINELEYLEQLKSGKKNEDIKFVTTEGKNNFLCVTCGKQFQTASAADSQGSSGWICHDYMKKAKKKSWQFWK
jgi:tetratricopeptide (TPR) repeat protein